MNDCYSGSFHWDWVAKYSRSFAFFGDLKKIMDACGPFCKDDQNFFKRFSCLSESFRRGFICSKGTEKNIYLYSMKYVMCCCSSYARSNFYIFFLLHWKQEEHFFQVLFNLGTCYVGDNDKPSPLGFYLSWRPNWVYSNYSVLKRGCMMALSFVECLCILLFVACSSSGRFHSIRWRMVPQPLCRLCTTRNSISDFR